MTIKEQNKLLNDCRSFLTSLNGEVLNKEQWFFRFKVKGSKNENIITLPIAEKSAVKGFIHVYSRFDKMNQLSGYMNPKYNVFISDFNDFQNYVDSIVSECYSEDDFERQKAFDATGERDLEIYKELYNQ